MGFRSGAVFVLALVGLGCASNPGTRGGSARASGGAGQGDAGVGAIAVNQLGYLPGQPKGATVVVGDDAPRAWQLVDGSDRIVAEGQTLPFGADRSSGDKVHRIDFSDVDVEGRGFRLQVERSVSPAFAITRELYAQLRVDALRFFYHQRSGMTIEMPYAQAEAWTRQAGHLGDARVSCLPELDCGFTLDVRGGWYDAGDHGKYVVNGGISVWTLLNLYERAVGRGRRVSVFGDAVVGIPEGGNEIDDLLDEVRYELEFFLRMQIPETATRWKGMAVHKIHDLTWTPLPTDPASSTMKRFLHAPSTAATLNLAATAAQAARVWRSIDPKFADLCVRAAERAWTAALAEPTMFAASTDSTGGGSYADDDVSDEFYWAASELYLTTRNAEYLDALRASPHFAVLPPADPTAMSWKKTAALGTLSLLTAGGLDEATRTKLEQALLVVANAFLSTVETEGYRTPLPPTSDNAYPWGSNSGVLNNAIVLAFAADVTGDHRYRAGVVAAMDYVLGRNALGQSYITGYGAKPVQNPHHRFWAHQLSEASPSPPPGILSGGPNSALQDPYARKIGLPGCAPQKCFVDHIESWSTNEVTINWNAPLVWVVDDLDAENAIERGV